MRPEQTPRRSDLPTRRCHVRAYFDYVAPDGRDVRIAARVAVDLPHDAGAELPVVARYRFPHPQTPIDTAYVGMDGECYLPGTLLHGFGRPSAPGMDDLGDIALLANMHPTEAAIGEALHHRISMRVRTHWQTTFRTEDVEDLSDEIDLAALSPSIAEIRAAASRLLMMRGDALHMRAPLPFWTFQYRDEAPAPQLRMPGSGNINQHVTAFSHDRLEAAMAYARLPSVRGIRVPGPPLGSLEIGPGWEPADDLSWVARHVGSGWMRDLDPVVPLLSADGVRDWHLGANAATALAAEGRRGAEAVLAGLLRLREEVAREPALAPQRFWVDKTRMLADRLVHIEGMNRPNELYAQPALR